MGILGYADDDTLLSPSIRGLISEEFSKDNFINFNGSKSRYIQYGEKYDKCEKAQLNKETIIWVNFIICSYFTWIF